MSEYRVVVKQDESGHWIADVPAIPGCHTFSRSLWSLQSRIREALSLWVDDADDAKLVIDVALPERVERAVARARQAHDRVRRAALDWQETLTKSVRALERAGFSRRDTADLIGLSHQRIQQIVRSPKG